LYFNPKTPLDPRQFTTRAACHSYEIFLHTKRATVETLVF